MIAKRILTAAVGIPLVACIVGLCGTVTFFLLALCVILLGLREFYAMVLPGSTALTRWAGVLLGGLILAGAYHDAGASALPGPGLLPGACALGVAAVFWIQMSRKSVQLRDGAGGAMALLCGLMYLPFLGSYLILLRGRPDGARLIFLLLLVAWAGDTAAFAIGSWKGRRRLSTRISPKKTIEGACASLLAGMLIALVFKLFFLEGLTAGHCLLIGLGLNILNQFGDLCESFVKRACNVKDSGTLFPGHGGVLDRIDSLLFAAPFLFYYINSVLPV